MHDDRSIKAVILAGGRGTRISEETSTRPKPMIEIGGYPILWHIMKSYRQFGISEFIICCGYLGYKIKEYFLNYAYHNADLTIDATGAVEVRQSNAEPWRVTLVDTGLDTMTGGRLARVAQHVRGDPYFCMTYGDGVCDVDIGKLIAFHESHGKLATITAVKPIARFGALDLEGDEVRRFVEKPQSETGYINGGFFVLDPRVLDLVVDDATIFEHEPLETLAARRQLVAHRHDGFWQPMDTLRDKHQLEDLWSAGAPWKSW